jgi:hypothetical protein
VSFQHGELSSDCRAKTYRSVEVAA